MKRTQPVAQVRLRTAAHDEHFFWTSYLIALGVILILSSLAWAAPPAGKGKANAPGQQQKAQQGNKGKSHNAQGTRANRNNGQAGARGNGAAAEARRTNRTHVDRSFGDDTHAPSRAGGRPSVMGRDRRPDRVIDIQDRHVRQAHAVQLVHTINGMSKGKWWKHPHDPRPQGNAGKVRMQDPFGFDKGSGREKRARGRPFPDAATDDTAEMPVDDPVVEDDPIAEEPVREDELVVDDPLSTDEGADEIAAEDGLAEEEFAEAIAELEGVTADFSLLEDYEQGFYDWLQAWMNWYDSLEEDHPTRLAITREEYYQQSYDHFFIREEDTTGLVTNRWDELTYEITIDDGGT